MTSVTGNVETILGTPADNVIVTFQPVGDTWTRMGSLIPPVEQRAVTDSNGDFTVSLHDGTYEVRFGGRGPISITVPDDEDSTYNAAELVTSGPLVDPTTFPVTGLNYMYSSTDHYFKNITTGLWHRVVFYDDPAYPVIEAATQPAAATSVPLTGGNFQFCSDSTWRWKNQDSGLFHNYQVSGARGEEYAVVRSGGSIAAATTVFARGTNVRIVDRLQQFLNTDLGKWATPYITGDEGSETLTLYPSVI